MNRILRTTLLALVLGMAATAPALAYETGATVQNFTATDSSGKSHSLASYRGKVVVVVAWCSRCMACKGYASELVRLAKANPQVVFLGVAPNGFETNATINSAKSATKIPFPVLRDSGGAVAKGFGAVATPSVFVIDAQGKLRYQGAVADKPKGAKSHYLADALTAAKSGASPAKPKTPVRGSRIKY
jgi:peroxiredoxin